MDSYEPFYYPLDGDEETYDVSAPVHISAHLYGVKSTAQCPGCGKVNVVVTLGASPDLDNLPCREFKFFTFFGIRVLQAPVLEALKRINPNYDRYWDPTFEVWRYLNACAECGLVFDEEYLRTEPGDAFHPLDDRDYERMQIVDLGLQMHYEYGWSDQDEDEYRTFEGLEVDCDNPDPGLWQILVERNEFDESLHSA